MTSFRFNFGSDCASTKELCEQDAPVTTSPGSKITVEPLHETIASLASPLCYTDPHTHHHQLKYLTAERVTPLLSSDDVDQSDPRVIAFRALTGQCVGTDLIPCVYEGGLVAWEGGYDLINYFTHSQISFDGLDVLELGCGSGLPGIYASIRGAKSVTLQDYNSEVINFITIPSVLLNSSDTTRHAFYSGSWDQLPALLSGPPTLKFDLILTSETIYSQSSQHFLLSAIKSLLRPTGQVLLAAKSYYFGVGGTCAEFEQLIAKDGYFNCERVQTIECSVPRVVLRLKPK